MPRWEHHGRSVEHNRDVEGGSEPHVQAPRGLDLLLAVGLERARPDDLAGCDVRGQDPARSGGA